MDRDELGSRRERAKAQAHQRISRKAVVAAAIARLCHRNQESCRHRQTYKPQFPSRLRFIRRSFRLREWISIRRSGKISRHRFLEIRFRHRRRNPKVRAKVRELEQAKDWESAPDLDQAMDQARTETSAMAQDSLVVAAVVAVIQATEMATHGGPLKLNRGRDCY